MTNKIILVYNGDVINGLIVIVFTISILFYDPIIAYIVRKYFTSNDAKVFLLKISE